MCFNPLNVLSTTEIIFRMARFCTFLPHDTPLAKCCVGVQVESKGVTMRYNPCARRQIQLAELLAATY